jgi:hypothetical protein
MIVEIWAEAALFPEKEYINGIAVAVHGASCIQLTGTRSSLPPDHWHIEQLTFRQYTGTWNGLPPDQLNMEHLNWHMKWFTYSSLAHRAD